MNGKRRIRDERNDFESEHLVVTTYEVELPDGSDAEERLVRSPKGSAAAVVQDPDKGILLVWRHRIAGDAWGWEIPDTRIDDRESPSHAAGRAVAEQTGWRVSDLKPLVVLQQEPSILDHSHHFFTAGEATWEGPAENANDVADVAWVPVDGVRDLLKAGDVRDGGTAAALLWAMTFGPVAAPTDG